MEVICTLNFQPDRIFFEVALILLNGFKFAEKYLSFFVMSCGRGKYVLNYFV